MLNLIVILTVLAQGLVGLFVFLKKKDSASNIAFGLLSLTTLVWAALNYYYTLNPTGQSALALIRLVMLFVVMQNTVFYVFSHNFPAHKQSIARRKLAIYLSFSACVALITLTPFVFSSVTVKAGQSVPNPGPLIPLFMVHAAYSITSAIRSLAHKRRQAAGLQKKQFQYILYASLLNWGVVPVTNFAITLVFQTTFFARVSPFYTLAFAGIIAYAIVSQRLFDIRAALARSVAYIFVMGTIAAVYSAGLFGIIRVIFPGAERELVREVASLVLVIPLILSFQSIKSFFDRITNQLFYQDAYDAQEFLTRLNSILVTNIDLHPLLRQSSEVITDTMKLDFSAFVILKTDNTSRQVISSNEQTLPKVLHDTIPEELVQKSKKMIVTDELEGSYLHIKNELTQHGIGIVVSLSQSKDKGLLGYIVLGNKKSGNPFNKQDISVLEIISNELVIGIQNSMRFEEIQAFNVTLQQKVNEATRQLRRTNEKLKALDQSKDEFISMASHQLRTPLTSVKGYVSMVLDGDAGKLSKAQKDLLGQAFASSQRMVYLIADLLNVSRLRTGKFIIENKPTQLADVVATELEQLKEAAKTKQQELVYVKPKEFPVLMLDETKIRQVIMNFTDNALYYTQTGGRIEVRLEDKHDHIEFTVRDNGIGVPKAEQHHMFTKFYRAGNARKARPDGTGLGLFMAKKVVVSEGGAIVFNSTEGKGSIFGFTFPKAKLKPPAGSEKTDSSDTTL